ncbi:hypothetical protein GcM3_135006 [Golovinomyces cichoracearum]|uniref:Uncharacterized protein n=1 Tax=Golovinomyces cichoracearum TaxID=62708 RepID=A0A420I310_9PEZI|nr:hypothetical protein GcM3_135006 [Golovinomyces cichoracearum]
MPCLFKPKKSACDKLILASTLAMGKRELGSCGSDNNNQIGDDANDDTLQDFDDNVVKFWHKETFAVAPHNINKPAIGPLKLTHECMAEEKRC